MSFIYNLIQTIEREKCIKIPASFLKSKGLKELDQAIKENKPTKVIHIYSNMNKFFDLSIFKAIEPFVGKNINDLSKVDLDLIKKLSKIKFSDFNFFLETSGNLDYIISLMKDMNRKYTRRTVKCAIAFWTYISLIELVSNYLGQILREYLLQNKKHLLANKTFKIKEINSFVNKFKDNEHPTAGTIINILKKSEFLTDDKESILTSNKDMRNKLSHANVYYDKTHKKIFKSNGEELPFKDLYKEIQELFNFLTSLIYFQNNESTDLLTPMKTDFRKIERFMKKIPRSGILKKSFNQVIYSWSKV